MLVLSDMKRDFQNGLISRCTVNEVMGAFTVRCFYRSTEKWEVLNRQRGGVRTFANVQAALNAAVEIGFRKVEIEY